MYCYDTRTTTTTTTSYVCIQRVGPAYRERTETCLNKKHLNNVGPIRHCEPPLAHSPGVASGTVARRLRIDVHDNNDNDNAWQRGPLWPHGMGPMIARLLTSTIISMSWRYMARLNASETTRGYTQAIGLYWDPLRARLPAFTALVNAYCVHNGPGCALHCCVRQNTSRLTAINVCSQANLKCSYREQHNVSIKDDKLMFLLCYAPYF